MKTWFLASISLVLSLSLASCVDEANVGPNDTPKTFYFTAIPDKDISHLRSRFAPMAAYLSEELGIKVVFKPVTHYALAVAAMTNKEVYLAWFGGLTGVQARERTDGEAIAQGEADAAFYSYFIAHPSSGLKPSAEFPMGIVGKSFTFGDKSSTSGRLMPEAFIREHLGKSPEEVFGRKPGFSGSHDLTIDAVAGGAFQVGAVNGKTWETKEAAGKTGIAYVIWKTPSYADYNWSVPGDIDVVYGAGFKAKLQHALLALDYSNPKHKKILDACPRKRFIKAANSDYQGIRATAQALGVIRD